MTSSRGFATCLPNYANDHSQIMHKPASTGDGALAEAERQLDADLEALFLQYGVNDNRYT